MTLNRRRLVAGAGAAVIAGPAAGQAPSPPPPYAERLAQLVADNRHRLAFDGTRFSGPAFDLMVREGQAAQFFLIGEEHGIAENPKLAAQLFAALAPAGYRRFGVEISAPLAHDLDRAAATGGFEAIRRMILAPETSVAFFGMAEEARMLADVRAALPRERSVFWGLDYEVAGDRRLIALLEAARKPRTAAAAIARLRDASTEAWIQYEASRDPRFIFSFAGDPRLITDIRAGWPKPDPASDFVLTLLTETFEINALYFQRRGWESNRRRSAFIRANFLRHWQAERGRAPRAMFKMGSSHLVRGRSEAETFDLGSLLPEVAAQMGATTFSVMMLPGPGRRVAVFDPGRWTYAPNDPKDNYSAGLEPIVNGAWPDAFTLVDMRPLRPLVNYTPTRSPHPELVRIVHGFDAVIVFSGSNPSSNL